MVLASMTHVTPVFVLLRCRQYCVRCLVGHCMYLARAERDSNILLLFAHHGTFLHLMHLRLVCAVK